MYLFIISIQYRRFQITVNARIINCYIDHINEGNECLKLLFTTKLLAE